MQTPICIMLTEQLNIYCSKRSNAKPSVVGLYARHHKRYSGTCLTSTENCYLPEDYELCILRVQDSMVKKSKPKWTSCSLFLGIICCVVALGTIAVSFATDQWINCEVKNGFAGPWSGNPLYNCTYCPEMFYTRDRGLFRTCYPGSDLQWVKAYSYLQNSLVDHVCLAERGYQVSPGDPSANDYGEFKDYYQMRIYLMRSHWSLFVVAMCLMLISVIIGTLGCWHSKNKNIQVTAALTLLTALSIAIGMGLFHGYYNLEQNKIFQAPMFSLVQNDNSYAELRKATVCGFGFSYGLGWASLVISTISFCIFLYVAITVQLSSWSSPQSKPKLQFVEHRPPMQPRKVLTQQDLTYRFFSDVAHHSKEPNAYPIPFDPYDLHLPTGISSSELRLPYNGQLSGKFDMRTLYPTFPANY